MRLRTRTLLASAALATGFPLAAAPQRSLPAPMVELGSIAGDGDNGGFAVPGFSVGDEMGRSVAVVGDVNGDGLADFAVGRPFFAAMSNYATMQGSVFVVFGKKDGISVDPQAIATDANNEGFVIRGTLLYGGHQLGYSVSGAGDVNGDGYDDIIIGAPTSYVYGGYGPGRGAAKRDAGERGAYGPSGAGAAFVVFGKSDGVSVDVDSLSLNSNAAGFVIGDAYSHAQRGIGLSVSGAGDVNGDGFDDVIVGIRQNDPYNCVRSESDDRQIYCPPVGAAIVVFGKADADFVDALDVQNSSDPRGFVMRAARVYDGVGQSVAGAGDVNGDGLADVIVGAPIPPSLSRSTERAPGGLYSAFVVFGKEDGLSVDLSSVAQAYDASGFAIVGVDFFGRAGASVDGAGDVNGDGLSDVIIGDFSTASSPGRALESPAQAGRSWIVFGKYDGAPVDIASQVGYGPGGIAIRGFYSQYSYNGIASGRSVSSAGDINGDGLFDVIVGAPKADYVYRYYYSYSYGRGGERGRDMVVFNGDGPSASGETRIGGYTDYTYFNVGKSFVVFGKFDYNTVLLQSVDAGSIEGFPIEGERDFIGDDDGFFSGFSVSGNLVGDINGDGLSDVAIGAPGFNPIVDYVPFDAGRSYVVFSPHVPSFSGKYDLYTRPGDGAGGAIVPETRFGDVARVTLNFSDDDFASGPIGSRIVTPLATPSRETVIIERSNLNIANLAPIGQESEVANVLWCINTDRSAWDDVVVTLKYIDNDIVAMTTPEAEFVIYRAASPAGPWLALSTNHDLQRREVSALVAGPDGTSLGYFAIAGTFPPLFVDVTSLAANCDGVGSPVTVSWETSAEINSVGFHVYAADPDGAGGWTKGDRLTDALVVAQGTPTSGASYAFVDPDELESESEARAYFLEDIDAGGRVTLHGPAVLAIRGIPAGLTDWKRFE